MRVHLALSLLAIILFTSYSTKAAELPTDCHPRPGLTCLGNPTYTTCEGLGETTMDGDEKNLIACLKDDSGNKVWKAMSNTESISYTYYCFGSNWGVPVCSDAGGSQGYCPAGWKQKASLGAWGSCMGMAPNYQWWSGYTFFPGGTCTNPYYITGNTMGAAFICSKP